MNWSKFRGKFRFRLIVKDEYQPLRVVSPLLWSVAVIALVGQIVFTLYVLEPPTAEAQQLQTPPSQSVLRLSALGDPVALARILMIDIQGFDNQKGVSLPFNQLDYDVLGEWLDAIVAWMSALNTRILAPLNCIPPWKMRTQAKNGGLGAAAIFDRRRPE